MPTPSNYILREGSPYLVNVGTVDASSITADSVDTSSITAGSVDASSGPVTANSVDVGTGGLEYPQSRLGPYTTNQIISTESSLVEVDTSGGAVTITLATALVADGAWVIVNDVGGTAGTNAITINTEGTATINGSSTGVTVGSNYGAVTLYSDGTNWYDSAGTGGTL